MNKQRAEALARIEKDHSEYSEHLCVDRDRAEELLAIIAEMQGEIDMLRGYAVHKLSCVRNKISRELDNCTCGLDKLLKESSDVG